MGPVDVDIRGLEESLWRPETRFDRSHMEQVLAADFTEIGRSGRAHDRAAVLAMPPQAISAGLPLRDLHVRTLGPDAVLVTYITESTGDAADAAHRCSVWTRDGGPWRLRFHQGTPAASGGG
jgi:hypothetical protein